MNLTLPFHILVAALLTLPHTIGAIALLCFDADVRLVGLLSAMGMCSALMIGPGIHGKILSKLPFLRPLYFNEYEKIDLPHIVGEKREMTTIYILKCHRYTSR